MEDQGKYPLGAVSSPPYRSIYSVKNVALGQSRPCRIIQEGKGNHDELFKPVDTGERGSAMRVGQTSSFFVLEKKRETEGQTERQRNRERKRTYSNGNAVTVTCMGGSCRIQSSACTAGSGRGRSAARQRGRARRGGKLVTS